MFHFEFVSGTAPIAGAVQVVGIATATEPEQPYWLNILAPTGRQDLIFANGFD